MAILEFDPACVSTVNARQHLHQGRLASTVLTHQGVHLSGTQLEVGTIEDVHSGESLDDAGHADERRRQRSG